MTPLIRQLRSVLKSQLESTWHQYHVPGLWVGGRDRITFPSAAAYLLHQLDIIESEERRRHSRQWSLDKSVVYNAMVRHISSYDHGAGVEEDGWRCTGTFLKLVGMIPYLLGLGVDTLVLMPITEVGDQGSKGSIGSPYAVKHPLHLESSLAEPAIPMSVDDQARVLVECCHAVGIKVVLEVVLRTASIDSDLVPLHPEWFYWIDEAAVQDMEGGFSAPVFSEEDLALMFDKVEHGDLRFLPEPPLSYQELFAAPPRRVERDADGWKGIGPKGTILRIPGAFADWPANDPQPAWTDVTYLRMHDHPHYRYMAYNTVRMYERELDTDEYRNQALWNTIAAVIPYYVRNLNIDGALIDMGHALPRDLRRKVIKDARSVKESFILFEENFALTPASREAGYDAAIGYLPFESHDPEKVAEFMQRISHQDLPTKYFATPESHNTKRAAARLHDAEHVVNLWQLLRLLPGGIPFIHGGMELGESTPVNTGLGFTSEEIAMWPPERLPLFSDVPLPWDQGSESVELLRKGNGQLTSWHAYSRLTDRDRITVLFEHGSHIGFWRFAHAERSGLLVLHEIGGSNKQISVAIPDSVLFLSPREGVQQVGTTLLIDLTAYQTRAIPFLSATNVLPT